MLSSTEQQGYFLLKTNTPEGFCAALDKIKKSIFEVEEKTCLSVWRTRKYSDDHVLFIIDLGRNVEQCFHMADLQEEPASEGQGHPLCHA